MISETNRNGIWERRNGIFRRNGSASAKSFIKQAYLRISG
ncbi:Protein of unknown function [Pyronema omphalodes CBS 100304]|uniref:Uncharacterized protein n=1 Tax=Pyronema omphalodes (strain CBS 100304) TaxID=1076935 RepID=U4LJB2_PYROM|nr:Protein of unknown function [Pyronema omphalodes CBS 100304]